MEDLECNIAIISAFALGAWAIYCLAFMNHEVNLTDRIERLERLEKHVNSSTHVEWMEDMQAKLDSLNAEEARLEAIKAEKDSLVQMRNEQRILEQKMRQDKLQEVRKAQARVNQLK